MWRILKVIIVLLIFLCPAYVCKAKEITASVVSSSDGRLISGAIVSISIGDSIANTTQTDLAGLFSCDLIDTSKENIILIVSALGYISTEVPVDQNTFDSPLIISLEEDNDSSITLSEVTVSADRSQSVKRTSNGQVFYLSKKAMKEHNPFLALAEIPLIISDYTTSSIKLIDGNQPLILIDGNQINSGINPIQPSDIESVEVITTVPARYIQDGYSGIVNIRLKKNRTPYVWFGGSYNQSIPASTISGPTARFEIGNEKFSVYGAAIYHYTRNEKISSDVNRSNTGYSQNFSSNSKSRSDRLYGWLLLKYIASPKDYLAASIRYNEIRSKSESASIGFFTDATTHNYISDEASKIITAQ